MTVYTDKNGSVQRTIIGEPLRWIGTLALTLAMLVALVAPAAAQDATPAATPVSGTPVAGLLGLGDADISAAVAAMLAVQAPDGGFIGFSAESDPGVTTDAVLALAAAEEAGVESGNAIDDALGYLEETGAVYAETGDGQRAKLVLAVEAAGDDSADFGGEDVWGPIEYSDDSAALIEGGAFNLSLIVLAADVVDSERTDEFTQLLIEQQVDDGSWAFLPDAIPGDGDSNTTSLAIQALVAAGDVEDPAIGAGLTYLQSARADDGGYGYSPSADGSPVTPDANSTALVLQAQIATLIAEDSPAFAADAAALAAFQNESGQFRYTNDEPDDNLFATVQAIPAIARVVLPIAA